MRSVFSEIITNCDETEMSSLVNAVLVAGIRQEEDLRYVGEDDIKHVLAPIQMRKLLAALKDKYGMR